MTIKVTIREATQIEILDAEKRLKNRRKDNERSDSSTENRKA